MDQGTFLLALVVAAVAVVILFKTAIVVPQQSAFIVERLGKYSKTLSAGFHILVPGSWSVSRGHQLLERIEAAVRAEGENITVFTHLEAIGDQASYEDEGLDREAPPSA